MTDNLEFELSEARARQAYFEELSDQWQARVKELEAEKARRDVPFGIGDRMMITDAFINCKKLEGIMSAHYTAGYDFEITSIVYEGEFVTIWSSPVNLGRIAIGIAIGMRRAYLESEGAKE